MPTRAKIPTVKRAKWMFPWKWYAVDADGTRALFTHRPHLIHGEWRVNRGNAFVVFHASTTPPKDPAKALRRIV